MFVGRDPKSLGETARSISKARMSVKSSALVLIQIQKRGQEKYEHADGYEQRRENIKLTLQVKIENRYRIEVPQ